MLGCLVNEQRASLACHSHNQVQEYMRLPKVQFNEAACGRRQLVVGQSNMQTQQIGYHKVTAVRCSSWK